MEITPEVQVQPIPTTATEENTADTGHGTSADVSICRVCRGGGERDDWLGCESCKYWVHLPCVRFDMKRDTHMIPAKVFLSLPRTSINEIKHDQRERVVRDRAHLLDAYDDVDF